MDHLPIPKNACTRDRAIVPYVCLKDYDGGPFLTYPIREGVPHALPPDGNIPGGSPYRQHERIYPTPKQEQEDFLQRWLFFGLIHEILGDRYRPEEFIGSFETEGGKITIVQTLKLVETLDSWIKDIRANCVDPRHTYEHIAECLRLAFATINGTGPYFDARIKLSLASLGEVFTFAVNEAYNITGVKHNKCPSSFAILIDYEDWKNTMLSSGWCPSQVSIIFGGSFYLQTMHFLKFLDSPASDGLHRKCNYDQCLAYQIDLARYQTKHMDGYSCEHLSIDTTRLNEILEAGSLPLVRIRKGNTLDELFIELIGAESTSHYIALSHVWADGLGNPYENALPRCQLSFLHETISKYYTEVNPQATEEVLLWCDTLCCPVELGKAKSIALEHMKTTYVEAFRVLVLDRSLHVYDLKTMDTEELCLRILNSGWSRRLWTLQEGALPAKNSRLVFLFRDEAINISDLLDKILQVHKSSISRKGLAENIFSEIGNFVRVSYKVEGDQHSDLGSVEAGLRDRSVSVPSDEPLLIANLLELDVTYILNGPCPLASCANAGCDHSRIHRLWLLMPAAFQGIPRTILLHVGPRLNEPGFRWAPSTLLHKGTSNIRLQPQSTSKNEDTSIASSGYISSSRHVLACILSHSLFMFVSTVWKATARFLFRIRINMKVFGWAIAVLGSLRQIDSVRESADRGIPISRGLLARFTGYSLSMARCPPGIPFNPWNIQRQEDGIFFRGADRKWYMMGRRLPVERDSFLSSKSLRAIIEEENNLWITHLESAFNRPQLIAKANGEQQVTGGLLVRLLSDEEGINYVETKLHISIGLLRVPMRNLLETAYECSKRVSRKLPAIRAAANAHRLRDEVNNEDSAQQRSILELLGQEIDAVAMQNASPDVVAASAAFSKNGIMMFKSVIAMFIIGEYGRLGVRTAETQEWCFD